MAKKCICFSRVSTNHQDLLAQRDAVKRAASVNYKESEIEEVYGKESAIKLKEEERQTLKEMKELIVEYPTIETIYFFAVDRLARRMSIVLSIAEWAKDEKINLVFLHPYPIETMIENEKGKRVQNPMAEMILTMMGFAASMEMNAKNARFANAKDWLRNHNGVTGNLSFGYFNNDGKIDINTKEASIINWCFDCYLKKGYSLMQIFEEGVELGYWKTLKQRRAGASKIRRILLNKMYCGKPCGKYNVKYPAIVDEDKINKAAKMMKARKYLPKVQQENIYYSKSILKDETSNTVLLGDKNHVRYFAANAQIKYGINLNIADSIIWHVAIWSKWEIATTAPKDKTKDIEESIREVETRMLTLQKKIDEDITPQMNRNYKLFIKGRISNTQYDDTDDLLKAEKARVEKRMNELKKRLADLDNLYNEVLKQEQLDIDVMTYRNAIEDDAERKKIIDETITKYTVNRFRPNHFIFKVWSITSEKPHVFIYISTTSAKNRQLYYVLDKYAEHATDFTGTPQDNVNEGIFYDYSDIIIERFKKLPRNNKKK